MPHSKPLYSATCILHLVTFWLRILSLGCRQGRALADRPADRLRPLRGRPQRLLRRARPLPQGARLLRRPHRGVGLRLGAPARGIRHEQVCKVVNNGHWTLVISVVRWVRDVSLVTLVG